MVKASIHQVFIEKDTSEIDESQVPDEENVFDSAEESLLFESRGAKRRRKCTKTIKVTKVKIDSSNAEIEQAFENRSKEKKET